MGQKGVITLAMLFILAAACGKSVPTVIVFETSTPSPTLISTPEPTLTLTLLPTRTSIPPSYITQSRSKDSMVMVYVPEGEFSMGSSAWNISEQPAHRVFLDAYWIDQTEVTVGMYNLCVQQGTCLRPSMESSQHDSFYFPNPLYADYPVIWMEWKNASTYCSWAGARLPTEAEWEKAARGTDGRTYPWGNDKPRCELGNFQPEGSGACTGLTNKVGLYPLGASPYGVLDMAGNIKEWVADWFGFYLSGLAENPLGPSSGDARVIRGGSFISDEEEFHSSSRNWMLPATSGFNLGFRCAMSTP